MVIQVTATKESLAASYAALCTTVSAHTGAPGADGLSNEVVGGAPPYARRPIAWNAGSSDGVYVSDPIDIDVPAGTYTHIGLWAGGTFRDFGVLPGAGLTFADQGVLRVTLTYTQT